MKSAEPSTTESHFIYFEFENARHTIATAAKKKTNQNQYEVVPEHQFHFFEHCCSNRMARCTDTAIQFIYLKLVAINESKFNLNCSRVAANSIKSFLEMHKIHRITK